MDSSAGDINHQRGEIQSSLRSIVVNAENWLGRLRRRQLEIRLISSVLTTILVFFGTLILGVLVALISANLIVASSSALSHNLNIYIQQHPNALFAIGIPAFFTAPIGGVVTYLVLKRKHEGQLKEITSLIKQIKIKLGEYDLQQKKLRTANPDSGEGIIEDAFSLTDQILNLLPEIARKRSQESLLFGFIGFLVTLVLGQNFYVAIVAGILVWFAVRYENKRSYEREISRFEEQKRIYEQRKDDFLATL